jgi:tRNA A-37 threonylcarbamoyl transferase component Bud32
VTEHSIDELARARVRWHVEPSWQKRLLNGESLSGSPLDAMLRDGSVRVVKHGTHRTVYRIDVAQQSFFLKRYRSRGLWSGMLRLLGRSASQREYGKALALAERHVPAIEPVAFGHEQAAWSGDDYLLTVGIADAVSLEEFCRNVLAQLDGPLRSRLRRGLIEALAILTADAHRAGALHDDLHSGNVLIEANLASLRAGDTPRLHWADVPGVELSGPLSWRRSRKNLVTLNWDWSSRATPAERRRFLKTYLRHRPDLRDSRPVKASAHQIARLTQRYGLRLMAGRDKRALATNRDFHHGASADTRWWAVNDVTKDNASALASTIVDGKPALTLSVGDTVVAVDACPIPGAAGPLSFLKRHPAQRQWLLAHGLISRGVAVRRPVMLVMNARAWLVYVRRDADRHPAADTASFAAVGTLLGRLHRWRYSLTTAHADQFRIEVVDGRTSVELADIAAVAPHCTDADRDRNLVEFESSIGHEARRDVALRKAFVEAYRVQWEVDGPDAHDLIATIEAAPARDGSAR